MVQLVSGDAESGTDMLEIQTGQHERLGYKKFERSFCGSRGGDYLVNRWEHVYLCLQAQQCKRKTLN